MGSSPGGIANMATALARLGPHPSRPRTDVYGDYRRESLARGEGADLTHSRPSAGTPRDNVSMASRASGTMAPTEHPAPPPAAQGMPPASPRLR
ncbi:Sugar kinase OS=Streptomyces antimycoticus OX=68175 GN=SANT12839_084290 PE=4 SV=1 [Streptomyces antimycoticus]